MENVFLLKDLAQISGLSTYTIKYYLKISLIREAGRSPETRFRYFDKSTLKRLEQIRNLRKQNKSLRKIQEVLKTNELF
ncbi:MAG: MerR family transcriptional regulator [Candidatus Omnitrophica bacterium]|nr:MerR family transcriptional regulator [Candidatus Omnitrophota bacterium]